jgi:hypothetical protein
VIVGLDNCKVSDDELADLVASHGTVRQPILQKGVLVHRCLMGTVVFVHGSYLSE